MIPRLKEVPFEFDGRTYILRCTYNVLADIQEMHGGIPNLASDTSLKSFRTFLTAMMNDYADEKGWPVLTERQVGRGLGVSDMNRMQELLEPVVYALYTSHGDQGEEKAEGENPN